MIQIRIKNDILLIEDKNGSIFDWEHRGFFISVCEFEYDRLKVQYRYSKNEATQDMIREVIEYFNELGVDYKIDDNTRAILSSIEEEELLFDEVIIQDPSVFKIDKGQLGKSRFIRELKPYQKEGFRHLLAMQNGANFSVPGSGKTSVVYAVYDYLKASGLIGKLIVIGPRSSFLPWEEEAFACFGVNLSIGRLTGSKVERKRLYLRADDFDIFLTTYQTATNDVRNLIHLCKKFSVFLIIDESHNIKKLEGGVWADALIELAPYACRRAVLSGTPAPNSYLDLWTQFTFLWPSKRILGNKSKFKNTVLNTEATQYLKDTIKPFYYRTTKKELALPKPSFVIVECELNPYQYEIYRALASKFLKDIETEPEEKAELREWRRARLIRLIQTASNPSLLLKRSEEFEVPPHDGSGASITKLLRDYHKYEQPIKFQKAIELINNLMSRDEKAVIWTVFVHNIMMLRSIFENHYGIEPFIIYGGVPKDDNENEEFNREQQIRAFKERVGPALLIANPAACAESISLHKVCHNAVYIDRTFNCGQYMQSLDRIHRIGLEPGDKTTYYLLLAKRTIDETINDRLEEKKQRMLYILEDDLPTGYFVTDYEDSGEETPEDLVDFEQTIITTKKYISI